MLATDTSVRHKRLTQKPRNALSPSAMEMTNWVTISVITSLLSVVGFDEGSAAQTEAIMERLLYA